MYIWVCVYIWWGVLLLHYNRSPMNRRPCQLSCLLAVGRCFGALRGDIYIYIYNRYIYICVFVYIYSWAPCS